MKTYPRLATEDAAQLMLELLDVPVDERHAHAQAWRGRATRSATASVTADENHLDTVRVRILAHARVHGFGVADAPTSGFDHELPRVLHGALDLPPAEAGKVEVWNYLTLVLLPDVAMWRWPNPQRKPGYERLMGKPRNVFRRHWWRGRLLGDTLAKQLSEDELVQISERSGSMGSDPRVGRAVAEVFLRTVDRWGVERDGVRMRWDRETLMREYSKAVLRYGRVVALSALSDHELRKQMVEIMDGVAARVAQIKGLELRRWRSLEGLESETVPLPVETHSRSIAGDFNQAMSRLVERAEQAEGVDSVKLRRLVTDYGAVAAALLLAHARWDETLPADAPDDLRIKGLLADPRYHELFDESVEGQVSGAAGP